MQFNGAPVIYVPGNAGSYKQARSLASVALRKGLEENWQKHLDYFTGNFKSYQKSPFYSELNNLIFLCFQLILMKNIRHFSVAYWMIKAFT